MEQEARDAERLHDALKARARPDSAARPVEPELVAMVHAAERLTRARDLTAGAPRPSFILGLEEQLRMDLRLGAGVAPRAPGSAGHRWLGLAVLAAGLGLAVVAVDRSEPGDLLQPLQAPLHDLRGTLAFAPARRAAWRLDAGWHGVGAVRVLVNAGRPVPWSLVDGIRADYTSALALADTSADPHLVRRVVREAADAGTELLALAPRAGSDGPVIEAGGAALVALVGRRAPVPVVGLLTPVVTATAVPSATFQGSATVAASSTPKASPPTATPEQAVVTAQPSRTPAPPTATPQPASATPAPVEPPPTRERRRTATPQPTAQPSTVTPEPPAATPTSDDWPTSGPPSQPSATVAAPTAAAPRPPPWP